MTKLIGKIEDVIVAVAFVETREFETAKEIMKGANENQKREDPDERGI